MFEKSLFVATHDNDNDLEIQDASDAELFFLLKSADEHTLQFPFTHKDFLESQSHQISRQPKKLIFHLQRIYYCFREKLPEQLYASLVDLVVALDGKKDGISQRMYLGSRKMLNEDDRQSLNQFFANKNFNENDLPLNTYSVLGKGRVSYSPLVLVDNNKTQRENYSALLLARDFIEYSQLDEARKVLEAAIINEPENKDCHEELLGLYKSTKDTENYFRMYEHLKKDGSEFLMDWEPLLPLFESM